MHVYVLSTARLYKITYNSLLQHHANLWTRWCWRHFLTSSHHAHSKILLVEKVESLSNQEEVELREKIEALGIELTKVPPKPPNNLNELDIAAELDRLSAKLDDVDKMISSTMATNPEVRSLLTSTADLWLPAITATADQRRSFAARSNNDDQQDP